ncbi:MAG TPA: hypothetical protein VIW73_02655 [Candidatus Cybelea sp.]
MDTVRFVRRALVVAAVAAVAGCAGSQVPGGTQYDWGSWMAPGAQSGDLLYVSDTGGRVYVYSYPAGNHVGTLHGFKGPEGVCSDSAGDVYVIDTPAVAVFKYAHGGTRPIEKLHVYGYWPQGCSVDPVTGDLAVADFASNPQAGPGAVTIYKNGRGMGTSYQDSSFGEYFFCSYDAKGNLYVDGTNVGTTQTQLAELPRGSTSFTNITLDKKVGPYPLAVQWDGKYVALQGSTRALYRIKVSGSTGRIVQTTLFQGDHSDLVAQFWIAGRTILIPYGSGRRIVKKVGLWPYPGGGAVSKSIQAPHLTAELFGTTLSAAQK